MSAESKRNIPDWMNPVISDGVPLPPEDLMLARELVRLGQAAPAQSFLSKTEAELAQRAETLSRDFAWNKPTRRYTSLQSFGRWISGLAALGALVALIAFSLRLLPQNPAAPAPAGQAGEGQSSSLAPPPTSAGQAGSVTALPQDEGALILQSPVEQERQGVTVAVLEGIVSDETHLTIQVEGLSIRVSNSQGDSAPAGSIPVLRLPDGAELRPTGGGGTGWGSGYRDDLVFQALPTGTRQVALIIPRLNGMPAGTAPEDWEIPLSFEPAPSGVPSTAAALPVGPESSPPHTLHGITLQLDEVLPLDDGYRFSGRLSWPADLNPRIITLPNLQLVDGSDREVPLELERTDLHQDPTTGNSLTWSFRIQEKALTGPLSLSIPALIVPSAETASFSLDLGPDPQAGDTWPIDQTLQIAGHTVDVLSARETAMNDGPGLVFIFRKDPQVTLVSIEDTGPHLGSGGTRLTDAPAGSEAYVNVYAGELPSGWRSFNVRIEYQLAGPWQTTWTPPAGPELPTPTPALQACLTAEKWGALAENPVSLPVEVQGRLLVRTQDGMFLVDLSGGERMKISAGPFASVDPAGKRVAAGQEGGLVITDLQTGVSSPISGTTGDDWSPVWSPQGDFIAFNRFADSHDVWLVRPDGSDLRQLSASLRHETVLGWSPDGRQVLFEESGPPDGRPLTKVFDLQTGAVADLLVAGFRPSGMAMAPGGDQVAFAHTSFGGDVPSVFSAGLDGSQVLPLASISPLAASQPVWSPDGRWLIVTVTDFQAEQPTFLQALIEPDTCQAYRIEGLGGEALQWLPPSEG